MNYLKRLFRIFPLRWIPMIVNRLEHLFLTRFMITIRALLFMSVLLTEKLKPEIQCE